MPASATRLARIVAGHDERAIAAKISGPSDESGPSTRIRLGPMTA